jgi:hypothetical protein
VTTGDTVATRTWTFELTGPALNANHRLHWRQERERKAAWRDAAQQMARSVVGARPPRLERASVSIVWVPPDARERDAENIAPVAKSVVDGIVRAGLLVDDSSRHIFGPNLSVGEVQRGQHPRTYLVRVTVEEMP